MGQSHECVWGFSPLFHGGVGDQCLTSRFADAFSYSIVRVVDLNGFVARGTPLWFFRAQADRFWDLLRRGKADRMKREDSAMWNNHDTG
jgi:hypothetical protein